MKLVNPLFGLATAAFLLAACQSNAYHIKGEAKGYEDGEVLYIADGLGHDDRPTDSIIVTEGRFVLHGETDTARFCRLYRAADPQQEVTFFLEPGDIYIEMSDRPARSRVSGTMANNGWQALNDKVAASDRELRRILHDEKADRATQVKAVYNRLDREIRMSAARNDGNAFGRFISTHYE